METRDIRTTGQSQRHLPLTLSFEGSQYTEAQGISVANTYSNYFIGNDTSRWVTHVPHFNAVFYRNVYPGVDVKYYGKADAIEYDINIAPGAQPRTIRLTVDGNEDLEIDEHGNLVVSTAGYSPLLIKVPIAYQPQADTRKPVDVSFVVLDKHSFGFKIGLYDPARALVIDPTLSYSTYLGGVDFDGGSSIAVDSAGNMYVVGYTSSLNFPIKNAYQSSCNLCPSGYDAFISKFNSTGGLVYSTFLGGTSQNAGMGIAVDSSQNVYVTGFTDSVDFPLKNPIQSTCHGCTSFYSTFITKLNSSGTALVYSTYLGGGVNTEASALAIDSSGNAYVAGWTDSTDFPLVNAFQTHCGGCSQFKDAFITKVNAAGSAWVYSTFLGGGVDDLAFGIAADAAGNAYLTGYTYSTDFPVKNPYQSTCSTCSGWEDAFVTKVGPTGALAYSTYLGGSAQDVGTAIAIDSSGNMYVTGYMDSANFPTKNAYQSTCNSNCAGAIYNVFVTKLNSAGSALVYSTYLGGSGTDYGSSIQVDSSGEAYVAGYTKGSSNFPTKNPIQAKSGGARDGFITKFTAAGSALAYSTYFGGSGDDIIGGVVNEVNVGGKKIVIGYLSPGNGLALDGSGNAYVTGFTGSSNFPTKNPYQGTWGGGVYDTPDAFVAKIAP